MSRNSIVVAAVCLAGLAVVVSGLLTDRAEAQGQPQILPGGRPARIRSYFISGVNPGAIIKQVEGRFGMIITDILVDAEPFAGSVLIYEDAGAGPELKGRFRVQVDGNTHLRFESGLPVSAGSSISVSRDAPGEASYTIMGYIY